jgi:hypothetical protein
VNRNKGTLLALAALLAVPVAAAAEQRFPAQYIVFSVDAAGAVTPEFYRRVTLAAPLVSPSEKELAQIQQKAGREEDAVEVRLADDEGRLVFQDILLVPHWIRGEFHHGQEEHGGWKIEGHRIPWEDRSFVVRLPVTGTRLSLTSMNPEKFRLSAAMIDLEDLAARADTLALAQMPDGVPTRSVITGSAANRVDLLIMGDGYTAAEMTKFNSDTANLENNFFNLSPYSNYKNYVNRVTLFTASAQSGADHPPFNPSCMGVDNRTCCSDPSAQGDSLAGTYVNTAFGGRYCAFNIHRLAVVDDSTVLAAASAYPDWDKILVLLNDATYGGSGGGLSVSSTHSAAVDIARHEYGHSFTGLADEYDTASPGYPTCSDVGSPACEANVTDQTTRALIKWNPWISAATPIPTPEGNPSFANVAGLFLGARYRSTVMYRHRDTECLMNFLGKPFGEVCGQEYVLQIYRGGWGTPASGIDPIEPGSEIPAPGAYTSIGNITLSAGLLGPVSGPAPSVAWKVNGGTVAGATGNVYTFAPASPGTYTVSLNVQDATPLVHPAMAGTDLQSSRSWTATVQASPAANFYTVTPCRIVDTRNANGPYGGPALAAASTRSFALASVCGIPTSAKAVSLNVTVTQPAQSGYLAAYPGSSPRTLTTLVGFTPNRTRSNNAVLGVSTNGSGTLTLELVSTGSAHVIIDVNGYFQ